jgi:hypothetical protein
MWKFRQKVWVKKHTTKKLVASRRFTEGGPGSGPHKELMDEHDRIKNHPFRERGDDRQYKMQSSAIKSLIGRIEHELLGGSTHEDLDDAREMMADASTKFYKGDTEEALLDQETALTRVHEFLDSHKTKESNGASLQVPQSFFEKLDQFGRSTDQDMKKSILGHHQDIMEEPKVREGGPGSGPHKGISTKPKENGNHEIYRDGKFFGILVKTPAGWRVMSRTASRDSGRHSYSTKADAMKKYFGTDAGLKEHGVQGQKWGVVNPRQDTGKPRPKPDLANDPRTMNMMQVIKRSQPQLNAIGQWQKNRAARLAQQNQKPPSPQQHHAEALDKLKELGWKALEVGARLTGMERTLGIIKSVVRTADGSKAVLKTDKQGDHSLKPAGGTRRKTSPGLKASVRESNRFREAAKTYYARSM